MIVNDFRSAATIDPPSADSLSPFTPFSIVIPRTNLHPDQLDTAMFVDEENTISVHYDGDNWDAKLLIPPPPKIQHHDHLWLYLEYGKAHLFEVSGNPLPNPG